MYIFFDTETNGLWRRDLPSNHKDQPRLVSMAFQVCDDKEKIIAQYSSRIEPKSRDVPNFIIPKEVEDIHGISTQEAQDTGIALQYPLAIMTYFISKCHTMVAHNLAFDLQILERELEILNFIYKQPEKLHCTMMMAKDQLKLKADYNDYKFPKLEECFKHFFHRGVHNYHDALLDVQLCRELYFHMKRMGIEGVTHQAIPKELLNRIEGDKYQNLINFLNTINKNKLNEWENNFCQSVIEKVNKNGDKHILLSDKQRATLRKIYTKHNGK